MLRLDAPRALDLVRPPAGAVTPEQIDAIVAKHITILREELQTLILGGGVNVPKLDRTDATNGNDALASGDRTLLTALAVRIGLDYNTDSTNEDLALAILRQYNPSLKLDGINPVSAIRLIESTTAFDRVDTAPVEAEPPAKVESIYGPKRPNT